MLHQRLGFLTFKPWRMKEVFKPKKRFGCLIICEPIITLNVFGLLGWFVLPLHILHVNLQIKAGLAVWWIPHFCQEQPHKRHCALSRSNRSFDNANPAPPFYCTWWRGPVTLVERYLQVSGEVVYEHTGQYLRLCHALAKMFYCIHYGRYRTCLLFIFVHLSIGEFYLYVLSRVSTE